MRAPLGVVFEVICLASGIQRCFDVHNIALAHSRLVPGSFIVEIDLFEAGESTHDINDAVAAVVACTDDDSVRV